VETAQDIVDRGLIPIVDKQYFKEFLAHSDNSLYQQLSNISVISPLNDYDWDGHIHLLKSGVQENNTHVYLTSSLWSDEKDLGRYHYSQEQLEGELPYGHWLINKKYHLSNELAKHMLIYAQVC
jgi:hypothetical protein